MKMNHKLTAVAAVACFAIFSATASDSKTKAAAAKTPESTTSSAVTAVATAHALVRYGDANKDALSLITAARMIKQAGTRDGNIARTGGQAGEAKGKPDAYAVDAILARAKALAGGRADLIAMADDVAKEGARGASNGPNIHRDVVRANVTDVYQVSFRGGERARVAVSGDYDTDLDLYVSDSNGNVVCKDDDSTDQAICGFSPNQAGKYSIRVVNRGRVSNAYTLLTN